MVVNSKIRAIVDACLAAHFSNRPTIAAALRSLRASVAQWVGTKHQRPPQHYRIYTIPNHQTTPFSFLPRNASINQDDHKAFRRQLEDKRPIVEANLLSGRQYVASEPPVSDNSDNEGKRTLWINNLLSFSNIIQINNANQLPAHASPVRVTARSR